MSPHEKPDDLARLLRDAVDDIEPRPGIEAIRSRTSLTKESPMTNLRTWFLGGFGAAVATAAVIGGVVLVGNNDPSADNDGGPVDTPTVSETVSEDVTETPSEPPSEDPTSADPSPSGDATGSDDPTGSAPQPGSAVPVYYVGDTPRGPRLYREFHANPDDEEVVSLAVSHALGQALDPDYRSGWPAGTEATQFGLTPDLLTINLEGDLHDLPAGMTAEQAQLAIEQLIYTAQAAFQQGRVPVQFMLNGSRTDQILGQPASEPLANGAENDVLSLVSLTSPSEGATVSGSFEASGRANSFEANVPWQILRGDEVVKSGFAMAEGTMDKLYPWKTTVDVSDLAPGRYTFRAQTDDPSGGAEGSGPFEDTRTIVVE